MPSQYTTIPLLGADYAERSGAVNSQRTVNMWPKITKSGSKSQIALYPTPGLTKFCIANHTPNRGNGAIFNSYAYFVVGDELVQIDSNGTPLDKGTFDTSAGRIEMVAGRDYLMIVEGASGWTWDGTTFSEIADVDFPASPSHVTYLDGYFITNRGDTDEFYISALENPTSWAALDFDAASATPDDCLALTSNNKDLYIFGSSSVQVYYNSGNPDFPFTAYSGGVLDFGIAAKYSLAESSSGIFLLATSEEGGVAIVQIIGFQGSIISGDISWDLEKFGTISDAFGFVYRIGDRSVYQITFPTENRTFEYIVESQLWIERKANNINRYLTNGHAFLGTKNIVGAYDSGTFYLLDEDVYTDDGEYSERIRVTQPIHVEHNEVKFNSVVLEIESGVGLVTGQGVSPLLVMRYSDDGGKTWSSELTASMGAIGEYSTILEWNKLGASRSRIFEFKVTDPVKVVIISAYARVRVLQG